MLSSQNTDLTNPITPHFHHFVKLVLCWLSQHFPHFVKLVSLLTISTLPPTYQPSQETHKTPQTRAILIIQIDKPDKSHRLILVSGE